MTGEAIMFDKTISETHSSQAPNVRHLLKSRVIVGVVAGILAQAMIYRHDAPFAWILLVIVWQYWRQLFPAALLGAMLGTVAGVSWQPALVLLVWSLIIPVPWRISGGHWIQWPMVALGASSLYWIGQSPSLWPDIVSGVIGVGAVLLYWAARMQIVRLRTGGIGDSTTLLLALAALGAFIAGLDGYKWGAVDPALVIGALMVVAAAVLVGPAGGAVAGATLGITLAVRGSDPVGGVGILVAGGTLAGWGATRQWRLASPGLVLGVLVYAVAVRLPPALTTFWLSLVIGAAIVQVLPDSYIAVSRQWATELITGREADGLPERLMRISSVMGEMARAFRIEEEKPQAETNMVETVVNGVCKKCSLYRSCWEQDFYRSYRGMLDLTAKAETDVVTHQHLAGDLARRCIRPDEIAHAANIAMNKERERATLALRVRESRELAELQLVGLSRLIKDMANDWDDLTKPRKRGRKTPPLEYGVGIAKRPRRGGVVSGDSELVRELSNERVVFGLSDGMGVGPRAAWESGTAISLLEQLLLAGFSQGLAVKAVNTTLLLRSVDDHFATLDLALMDRSSRGIELVKVAAAPTFWLRDGHVEIIRAQSLPVGIVNEVTISPVYHTIKPGDVLVLVTDGVLENIPQGAEERLAQFLQECPPCDPKMLAETILSYMLGDEQDGRDDASAMVVEVRANGDPIYLQREDHGEQHIGEWQRLTPISLRGKKMRGL